MDLHGSLPHTPRRKFNITIPSITLARTHALEFKEVIGKAARLGDCANCSMTVSEHIAFDKVIFNGDFPIECPKGKGFEDLCMRILSEHV